MLTVSLDSDEPLVDQIVRGIRAQIAADRLVAGAELPAVRQLAADLGINLNTVARAYRVLQHSGLVHTARGRGTRVTAVRELTGEARRSLKQRLRDNARTLLSNAKLAGLSRNETETLLVRELDLLWPTDGSHTTPGHSRLPQRTGTKKK